MALTMPTSLWLGGEFETAVRDYAAKRPRGEPSQVKGLPVASFLALGLLFILRSAPSTAAPPLTHRPQRSPRSCARFRLRRHRRREQPLRHRDRRHDRNPRPMNVAGTPGSDNSTVSSWTWALAKRASLACRSPRPSSRFSCTGAGRHHWSAQRMIPSAPPPPSPDRGSPARLATCSS